MTEPRLPQQLPESVKMFRTELRRIPLRSWANAARTLTSDPAEGGAPVASPARARLRAAIEHRPEVTARIRRSVDGLVAVAEGIVHPRDARLMRKAALSAAFALAARPDLDEADFADLYRPFAELIPLTALEAPDATETPDPTALAN